MMSFDLDPDEQHVRAAIEVHRRDISQEQMCKFESAIAAILTALGLDLDTPATRETPQRFLRKAGRNACE